jgi:purine-binding chemotaxis protein CheW
MSAAPRVQRRRSTARLVVFRLDAERYALPLAAVERVVRAVAVTPVPKGPDIVLGVIDIAGLVIPVLSLRRRFHLRERPIQLSDELAIVRTWQRTVALLMDGAEGVIERADGSIVQSGHIVPGLEHVSGVLQLDDGLVLIHDLDSCLSLEEGRMLDAALQRGAPAYAG